ncbi:MAG TPA: hypothetical protein DIW30_07030 [Bacteroidales bacterium]|nr:hypothetical protein [Bacteroidales bacterium]
MKEIKDTEIRVIGNKPARTASDKPHHHARLRWLIIAGVLVTTAVVALLVVHRQPAEQPAESVFEEPVQPVQQHPLRGWIAAGDTITRRGTLLYDTVVNDIPLRLMRPMNVTPHLEVGYKCLHDTADIILMCQAADIRADNKKIVGAFVLHGKPLSWGLSKRGYCAIIDKEVTVGVADNSPLFEEATERGGDFFRQYPLVDNGVLVENELKAKFIRRALCELEGRIVVAETGTPESMHDFTQALVDIGVTNAIYLVGSTAIGWYIDLDGVGVPSGTWEPKIYKNISFIVWE